MGCTVMDERVILFTYPSRGRPERFFEGLDSIVKNMHDQYNYIIQCKFDVDDESMQSDYVLWRLSQYEVVTYSFGESVSKIHAVNRNIPKNGWDIICVFSDDMRFTSRGVDTLIRQHCTEDTLIHIPDNTAGNALATMYIADKVWYSRWNYVYHPSYISVWADNEIQEVAQKLGRYRYIDASGYIEHQNPAYGQYTQHRDRMFDAQQSVWPVDEANYLIRKANNFYL